MKKFFRSIPFSEKIGCTSCAIVDHPEDSNLFKKYNPVKFVIIRPLKFDQKLSRGTRQDNLSLSLPHGHYSGPTTFDHGLS